MMKRLPLRSFWVALTLMLSAALSLLPSGAQVTLAAANGHVLIAEVYANTNLPLEPEEYVALHNPTAAAIDLSGWQLSNGTAARAFSAKAALAPGKTIYVTKTAARFTEQLGFKPDYEYGGNSDNAVPDLDNVTAPTMNLGDKGGMVMLKDSQGRVVDVMVYGTGKAPEQGWSGSTVPAAGRGEVMFRSRDEATMTATSRGEFAADTDTAADWIWGDNWRTGRTLAAGQSFLPYPSFTFTGNITAYSMPDSAYSVLSALVDSASTAIDLNVYEFHNASLKDKLVAAAQRGVAVRVFLEGGPVGGLVDQGRWVAQELTNAGAQVRFIVHKPLQLRFQRYDYDHAKYAIVDGHKVFVQSENWAETGVPVVNTFGNRGWGVVIENQEYAAFMTNVFNSDWDPRKRDSFPFTPGDPDYGPPPAGFKPDKEIPTGGYVSPFAAKTFTGTHTVTPVVIPEDGLLLTKGILGLLKSATKTLYVEQLYIHKFWGRPSDGCNEVKCPDLFLAEVINAARRGVKVRVLLDSAFLDETEPKDNTKTVAYINQIAAAEQLDMEARLIDLNTTHVEKIHNKGVIVDGQKTLISSINWSENSPANNREMGVIVENPDIADFYSDIFYYDWYNGNPVNWVTISEVMYNPRGAESAEEWVELYNPTGAPVDLSGWTLTDNGATWKIPAGTTIGSGQYLVVARDATAFKTRYEGADPDLSGLTLGLANTGDVVRLRDTTGFEIDRVAWGNYLHNWSISSTEGKSLTRVDPGKDTNTRLDWAGNTAPTPGTAINAQ